jgi:hypothetical protein
MCNIEIRVILKTQIECDVAFLKKYCDTGNELTNKLQGMWHL